MDEKLIVLFEDNHIIVVVKPQNIPTQGDSSGDVCLLDMVREYVREKYQKPGNVFIGLVHRLDRPAGGVMVFAKTSKGAARLSLQMRAGELEKRYLAVTCARPRDTRGRLVNFLIKNPENNTVRISTGMSAEAKRAELDYYLLESFGGLHLIEIRLITGRSHQARVQMAGAGCPIFGDVKYGASEGKGANLALWAYSLKFQHPTTQETMVFKVFPPESEPWKGFAVAKHVNVIKPE